jgi:glycosyltransferase involved in cell wall biosynthesis
MDPSPVTVAENSNSGIDPAGLRVGILASHPIQYQAPWFRELAKRVDLEVLFAHSPTRTEQGEGFGRAFTWDVDLLRGYHHRFLNNVSKHPNTNHYGGCDTPDLNEVIKNGKFDAFIVNGWYLKCYWQAIRACRKMDIPVLVRGDSQLLTPRSKLKQWLKKGIYRRMLKQFDGFLTVGVRHTEYLRHYGVPSEKIFSAPHFVDNDWYHKNAALSLDNVPALRNEWHAGAADLVVLFVGKFIPEKQIADLVAATARCTSSISCRLVLVGSGALEGAIRKQAAALGIDCVFAGFKNQSELPQYYAAADVHVLPSLSETWGLVVNEAMACGTPAIVSGACGCAPDLIEAGTTGFTFPANDVAALAECLGHMAQLKQAGHDWKPALCAKIAQYSVEVCAGGTMAAVKTVIARRA